MRLIILSFLLCCSSVAYSQQLCGTISSNGKALAHATIAINDLAKSTSSDSTGFWKLHSIRPGQYQLKVSAIGYKTQYIKIRVDSSVVVNLELESSQAALGEVVVTGTMKEVSRLASPVPVEVYSPAFFRKNPTPSVFDALQNVNGVRPQLNCNVCNTGDIHINGLEGPYTMILIDGMPIVSGLSSVYGLSGIPNAMIERIEIVKGPASSLYGSEAVGGLINIITKKPAQASALSADVFGTSWGELNMDLGVKLNLTDKVSVLTGINYFKYGNTIDRNRDNFTDITLQDRISVFQKWNFARKNARQFSLAARYNYEDRWGGDITWSPEYRGGSERYGESVYTNRWELLGVYQLPIREPVTLSFSANSHQQNSVYGNTAYLADQKIVFGQLSWDKKLGRHDLLIGSALRYTFYDDNTPATETFQGITRADQVWLPGVFIQDELKLSEKHTLLAGLRYDYNSVHGNIFTPRLAYKWAFNERNVLRLNAGTGFRVVSLFTEEHAALTGSRELIVSEELKPERSYNANLNFVRKFYFNSGSLLNVDASAWYTHFNNQIIPDYLSNPNQIIYANLNGHAVSRGLSANLDMIFSNGIKVLAGGSLLDVFSKQNGGSKQQPFLTEKWTATWALSYQIPGTKLNFDYTGNIYGPMQLPLLGELDPRSSKSPVWSIQNIQMTFNPGSKLEFYGGLKNLLNWTPGKSEPFLIARSNDPFDKNVIRDGSGNVIADANNPYALSFDPTYVYAPNQGMRGFFGMRYTIR